MPKTGRAKWLEESMKLIPTLPNARLLHEVLSQAGGDDYDGGFTKEGFEIYKRHVEELVLRLWAENFISELEAEYIKENI